MAEYIEREALLKAMSYHNYYPKGKHFLKGIETAEEIIEHFPAADVQPVKHGLWVQDAVYVDETTGEPCLAWFCNQCGEPQMVGTNYCPNCGARMDGEE